jgi:hypothetical protein
MRKRPPAGSACFGSSGSDAFGGKINAGLTLWLGEGSLKFCTELRYHHASHNNINTDTAINFRTSMVNKIGYAARIWLRNAY